MNTLVIDSNILISALIKNSKIREILTNFKINFLFPELGLEEIYFYKQEILEKAEISDKEFNIILLRLLKYVKLIPLDVISCFREKAEKIIGHIDRDDVIFIATALAFNCPIWSDDRHFKKQDEIEAITTKDMVNLF